MKFRGERANLQSALLVFAPLRGAKLGLADLSRADLQNADLRQANLFAANLSGAMLYCKSHVGLCYWPTKVGRMHGGLGTPSGGTNDGSRGRGER